MSEEAAGLFKKLVRRVDDAIISWLGRRRGKEKDRKRDNARKKKKWGGGEKAYMDGEGKNM